MKIRLMEAEECHGDRRDEVDRRFSQFCECVSKQFQPCREQTV